MDALYKRILNSVLTITLLCCLADSASAQVPVAKFGPGIQYVDQYGMAPLFDSSSNAPFAWEWDVYDSVTQAFRGIYATIGNGDVTDDPNGNGRNRYSKNPEFGFDVPGKYTVTLRCRNSSGWSAKKIVKKYIIVGSGSDFSMGFGVYGKNSDNVIDNEFGNIYDNGGPINNYSNNNGLKTKSYLTIKPCRAKKITLTMHSLKFADAQDILYVYDGDKADYSKLLSAWTRNNTGSRTVTAMSGSMYILFKSNGSGIDSGFFGSFTFEQDTAAFNPMPDFTYTKPVYNSRPLTFYDSSSGLSGVADYQWAIEGVNMLNGEKNKFNYTFYTDGNYQVCMKMHNCEELRTKCKTISVATASTRTKINFKAHSTALNMSDSVWLTPLTDKANRFEWRISPASYVLLNPPALPSFHDTMRFKDTASGADTFFFKQRRIVYNATPGDSLPKPCIRFLDTVCYSVTLIAYNSLDPNATVDTLRKHNFICDYVMPNRYEIRGRVFLDVDADCGYSGSDKALEGYPVKLYDSLNRLCNLTYSLSNGMYLFDVVKGRYNIVLVDHNKPFRSACAIGSDSTVNYAQIGNLSDIHFPLTCKTTQPNDVQVEEISIRGLVFPGQKLKLGVALAIPNRFGNMLCRRSNTGGKLKVSVVGKVTFDSFARKSRTATRSGSTFTYIISNFDSVLSQDEFKMHFHTDTNARGSDTINILVELITNETDADTSNNKLKRTIRVVNSYDPNMKEVYPGNVDPEYKNWFNYTIHFQNTGTAQAFNIRLEDTLDSRLDLETFEVIESSHPNFVDMRGRKLKFYFKDIMLPDSFSDEAGSKGFVSYRIKPVAGLQKGTKLYNTAYIYFDYNEPVVTNTTVNAYVKEDTVLYKGIYGVVYHDANADCARGSGETGLANIIVRLYNQQNVLIDSMRSNDSGFYQFFKPYGNYRVELHTAGLPLQSNCNMGYDSTVQFGRLKALRSVDFALACQYVFDPAVRTLMPKGQVEAGLTHIVKVGISKQAAYGQLNCGFPAEAGQLILQFKGKLTYKSAAPGSLQPSSINGNVITYSISDFNTLDPHAIMPVFEVMPGTTSRDSLEITASVLSSNDADTGNNKKTYRYFTGNRYEPFKKSVSPVLVDPGYSDWITYTIPFSNMGSGVVETVRITDTLDARLDASSVQILSQSHAGTLVQTNQVLDFTFSNIQLPDSVSSKLNSEGHLQFMVKPYTGLDTGIKLYNTAYVHMGMNSAVRTNTIYTEVTTPPSNVNQILHPGSIQFYPNPSTGKVNISAASDFRLKVTDISGRLILTEDNPKAITLEAGVYYLVYEVNGYRYTEKLVVLR